MPRFARGRPYFAAVRAEFELPDRFPPEVLAEAAAAAAGTPPGPRVDATGVELVTIDPPGSKDLDQAVGVTRHGDGTGTAAAQIMLDAGVPGWLAAALPELPALMSASDARAAAVGRACIDRTEATLLAGRVGEAFPAIVLRGSDSPDALGEVYLDDPPVLGRCTGPLAAGATVRVRLVEADPSTGAIAFAA